MYISGALPGLAGNQAGLVCTWESWREYVRAMAGVVRMCHIENAPRALQPLAGSSQPKPLVRLGRGYG